MAENNTPSTEPNSAHSEPMTAEMQAAVDANSSNKKSSVKKSAKKKKSAVKKKAAPKKKSAVKKKSAPKKKAVPKKKSSAKKKAAPKKKTQAASTASTKTAAAIASPSSKPDSESRSPKIAAEKAPKQTTPPVSKEDLQHQQQIRQKLVDLGVADAEEIGAKAHEEPTESNGPFWIKAIIALIIIVGLYFYSKEGNNISTAPITEQPMVTLDNTQVKKEDGVAAIQSTDSTAKEGISTEDHQDIVTNEESAPEAVSADEEKGPSDEIQTSTTAAPPTSPVQPYYGPGYMAPNPWSPDYYPPFNTMNPNAPVNPYYYPPINMMPGAVPPPYYGYPVAPYPPMQTAPIQ